MMKWGVISVLLLFVVCNVNAEKFSSQQKAWLYKVVKKSPCLDRNLSQYFVYSGRYTCDLLDVVKYGVNSQLSTEISIWDSIEHSIVLKPELLKIDWQGIQKVSPGVLAEASLKLTLWELYSDIKAGYYEMPQFSKNITAKYVFNEMLKVLPDDMKSGGEIKQKYKETYLNLINPSLHFHRKKEAFALIKKVSLSDQKYFFEKQYELIGEIVKANSEKYFTMLCGKTIYFSGELLAVGEGSGSSGLLREYENVDGQYINTGTGKGIGLFTYKIVIKNEELQLQPSTEIEIPTLKNEPTLLHLSLWGMDWSKKPLVVIENGNKTYLLFGSVAFSPDEDEFEGTSYLDMIKEFKKRRISKIIKELNKDGGLLSVYERERLGRDKIKQNIDLLNLEIDSLKKLENPSEVAIQKRISKNEVNLVNLSAKENRLNSIQKKIALEYQKVDQAENELIRKKALLGKNIQDWKLKDSVYTFADGTQFNMKTQDLIIFNDRVNIQNDVVVRLLSATYSVYSDKKDEVQLYVNSTGGVNTYIGEESSISSSDTLLKKILFFEPDGIICKNCFTSDEVAILKNMVRVCSSENKKVIVSLMAMGVDTINHPHSNKKKFIYDKMKETSQYVKSRRVDFEILKQDDNYYISIKGYADPGNTRLSKVSDALRITLGALRTEEYSLNPALSLLRVRSVFEELKSCTGVTFSESKIEIPVLHKEIDVTKLGK